VKRKLKYFFYLFEINSPRNKNNLKINNIKTSAFKAMRDRGENNITATLKAFGCLDEVKK